MTYPSSPATATRDERLRALAARRWRVALSLTIAMIVVYFGFIALVAFDRPLLATPIGSGLTLGILLGAVVIVASWVLTYVYVRWANVHYDSELEALQHDAAGARGA